MSRKSKHRGDKVTTVRKLSPADAAARDEGPRLIPLDTVAETPKIKHWHELADSALRAPRPKHPGVKGDSASS